jgi:hypothetical protein
MFLTRDDIERLTGFKHKAKQRAQLVAMHIPFRENARGEPLVTEAYIEGTKQPIIKQAWTPTLLKSA